MELLEIFEFDLLECLKIIFKTPQLTNFFLLHGNVSFLNVLYYVEMSINIELA